MGECEDLEQTPAGSKAGLSLNLLMQSFHSQIILVPSPFESSSDLDSLSSQPKTAMLGFVALQLRF